MQVGKFIVLPTEAESVQIFEKTLIGGSSAVNTRLAFNTNILFPNEDEESKKQDLKISNNIKNKGKTKTKRVVSKILKMDETNQYGNAITKSLPYDCIKKQELRKFNMTLPNLSDENKIRHLLIATYFVV